MKKFSLLLVAFCCYLSAVSAETTFTANGICYAVTSSTAPYTVEVIQSNPEYSGDIAIPASVSYGGTIYAVTGIGEDAFYLCENLTSVDIPTSVTSIGNSAFNFCENLTSVVIPNSVTSIGKWAFQSCSNLTSITIPNSLTTIGTMAFIACTGLRSITIPNTVTKIDTWAFAECSNLKEVVISESVTSIGQNAFQHCDALTTITCLGSVPPKAPSSPFSAYTATLYVHYNSLESYKESFPWKQFNILSIEKTISVTPDDAEKGSVTGGGLYDYQAEAVLTATANEGYEFVQWSDGNTDNPRTITVTEDMTLTAEFTCKNLKVYDTFKAGGIRYAVTSIEPYTVMVTNNLKQCSGDIVVPASVDFCGTTYSVTKLGAGSFQDCAGLTSVVIPTSVTIIGVGAFRDCIGLTNVVLPNSIMTIEGGAFQRSGLQKITLNPSLEVIDNYAFFECTSLKSIDIPDKVRRIGKYAFQKCSSLESVRIGSSVTSIDELAFRNCDALKTITCLMATPPVINQYVFTDYTADLYVHYYDMDAYKAADVWKQFNILPIEKLCTVSVTSNDAAKGSVTGGGEYYATQTATITATANEGYKFTQWSDGNTDNPRTIVVTEALTLVAEFAEDVPSGLSSADVAPLVQVVDGTVVCSEVFRIYNLTGQEMTAMNGYLPAGVYIVRTATSAQKVIID